MTTRKLIAALVRCIVGYAALMILALTLADAYTEAVVPLYRLELRLIAPDYAIEFLGVDRTRIPHTLSISARYNDYFYSGGRLWPPGSIQRQWDISTKQLNHVILLLLVPLVWPWFRWQQRIAALACAIPFLLLVEILDTPLIMLGFLDTFKGYTLTTVWMGFLVSGGEMTLSLSAGVLACIVAAWAHRTLQKRSIKAWMGGNAQIAEDVSNDEILVPPTQPMASFAFTDGYGWNPVVTYRLVVRLVPDEAT